MQLGEAWSLPECSLERGSAESALETRWCAYAMRFLLPPHRRTFVLVLFTVGLVVLLRRDARRGRSRAQVHPAEPASITPTELAVELWGASENGSGSWGSRRVRAVARDLFEREAPGRGGSWSLTPMQAAEIRRALAHVRPPLD